MIAAVDYVPGPCPSFEELRKRREAKRQQQQVIKGRLRALDARIKEMQAMQRKQRKQRKQRQQRQPDEEIEIVNESLAKTTIVRRRRPKQIDNQGVQPNSMAVDSQRGGDDRSGQKPLPLPLVRHNPSCPSFLRPPEKPPLRDPFSMTV